MSEKVDTTSSALRLPVLRELTLSNFSLYRNKKSIHVSLPDGVFCLAGANGLGKSTFLNTLNYAVTGIVPDPNRKFDSLDEYYRYTGSYSKLYYLGRIEASDREVAYVNVKMSVGENLYNISRRFSGAESVSFLEIEGPNGKLILAQDDLQSETDRNDAYKDAITEDTGLASFQQLVFLQTFVLTFDERRRLLLWDDETIEQALLLAFGVDPQQAEQADNWRRRVERLDSQARNLQYQATVARNRIKDVAGRVPDLANDGQLDESYEELERERSALLEAQTRINQELDALKVKAADTQSGLKAAETAYEVAFGSLIGPRPELHPVILRTLEQDRCDVCGTDGVRGEIENALGAQRCPLCHSIVSDQVEFDTSELDKLNDAVGELRSRTTSTAANIRELEGERHAIEAQISQARARWEPLNDGMPSKQLSSEAVKSLIEQYEAEAMEAIERRDDFRKQRDQFKRLLAPVSRQLAIRYALGEEEFVPSFRKLAEDFLGLDVDVYLNQRAGRPNLIVTVEGVERRAPDHLSESQRYFLDIALRMALVDHIARPDRIASLYIDTPEGSLDISYEARAGQMFSAFVASKNKIVMTANINTSRLLQSLARECGTEKMTIVRMTDWTSLSDVQAEGEHLFDAAMAELEAALRQGPVG